MAQSKQCWIWFLAVAVPAAAQDWPQFLGPNRNGACSVSGLEISWPKEGPPVLWQVTVGEGFSAPVVAQNKVIVFHPHRAEERIDCLDAANSKTVWRFNAPAYSDSYGRGAMALAPRPQSPTTRFSLSARTACFIACGSQTEKLSGPLTPRRNSSRRKGFRRSNFSVGGRTPGATERRQRSGRHRCLR